MSKIRENYLKNGYVIKRNYLSTQDINDLRNFCINKKFEDKEIFEYELIKKYFFNPNFFKIFKEILNCENLIYFSDSSINVHKTIEKVPSGFHVDSRNENYNFDEEYPIVRIGVYLENIKDFSGGIKVKPGSHQYYCITKITQAIKTIYQEKILKKNRNFKMKLFDKNIQPDLNLGDLIIWNMRLHHSGASWRYKFNKLISLHPIIDKLMPKFLKIPPQFKNNRTAIFFAFANGDLKNNQNIDNYIARKLAQKKKINNIIELKENFAKNNVLFLN